MKRPIKAGATRPPVVASALLIDIAAERCESKEISATIAELSTKVSCGRLQPSASSSTRSVGCSATYRDSRMQAPPSSTNAQLSQPRA